MFAEYAGMFTIRLKAIRKMAFPEGQLLKIYRRIGLALFAAPVRVNLHRNNGSNFKSKRYLCWLRRRLPQHINNMPAEPPPCRLDIIFDLKPEKIKILLNKR
jgi:hypothetical protein